MRIIVDANIFFSAFIRKNSTTRHILASPNFEFLSPEWFLEEFDRNQDELIIKMDNPENFLEVKELLLSFIKIVPKEIYENEMEIANLELNDNKKDIPYIALALKFNALLLTNDQRLAKQQGLVKIITVQEILRLL